MTLCTNSLSPFIRLPTRSNQRFHRREHRITRGSRLCRMADGYCTSKRGSAVATTTLTIAQMQVCPLRPRAAERDWRQAMPRAEPALNLAPLRIDKSLFGVILLLLTHSFCQPTPRRRRPCIRPDGPLARLHSPERWPRFFRILPLVARCKALSQDSRSIFSRLTLVSNRPTI